MTLRKSKKNKGYSLSPYSEKDDTLKPVKIKWIKQIPDFSGFTLQIESLNNF